MEKNNEKTGIRDAMEATVRERQQFLKQVYGDFRDDINLLKLDNMVNMFEKRVKWQKENNRPLSKQLMTQTMLNYFKRVRDAKQEGRILASTAVLFFPELLLAMDMAVFPIDQYSIQMLSAGFGYDFIGRGEAFGFSKEGCSPHIATVGMAAAGIFPKPDLMFAMGPAPCDSAAMLSEVLNHIYKCPIYWFSYPYREDEEAIQYMKEQVYEIIEFVEKNTPLRYDEDRLRQSLEIAKACQDYYLMTHNLRKSIPTPLSTREALSAFGPRMSSEGLPETVEFMKALYEETKEKVDKGIGAIPNERFRVVTSGAYPFWHLRLFDWMEEEFGAVVVMDFHNTVHLDPIGDTSDPIDCLARKTIRSNAAGRALVTPYSVLSKEVAERAIEFKCNASIFFAHFGCKQTCGFNRVHSEAIKEIVGIPTAIVDIDACNPLIVSVDQMKSQISKYFDMLSRKGVAME